jgi:steroid delta-isomerase-like uncharacterized protein
VTDLSPEGVVRRFFEALRQHDFPLAAGAIAEHCEWQSVATGTIHRGPTPIISGLREFVTGFPDWTVSIERLVAADSLVVVEWSTTGTFRNAFRGKAANGKSFRRCGCAVAEVEGGKIVRYRDYYDRTTLNEQLDLS